MHWSFRIQKVSQCEFNKFGRKSPVTEWRRKTGVGKLANRAYEITWGATYLASAMMEVRVRIHAISHFIEKETSPWTGIYQIYWKYHCTLLIAGSHRNPRHSALSLAFRHTLVWDRADGTWLSTRCIYITSHYGFATRPPRSIKTVASCAGCKI